jgi:hypothetical protein
MQKVQKVGALLTVFLMCIDCALQAKECLLFATYASGREEQCKIVFETEEQCAEQIELFLQALPEDGLCKLAYSMENPPAFFERRWEKNIEPFQREIFGEQDFYFAQQPFSFMGNVKLASSGWGSAAGDEKAKTKEAEPFFALRLTPRDRKNIQILMTDLSDKTYLQLFVEQTSMNRKGDRVRVVHPMRFIGYILSDPHLHRCLKTVEKDSLKYKEFIRGFEEHMMEKESLNEFLLYAPGFAELIEVDTQAVIDIIESKNYADLIKKFV